MTSVRERPIPFTGPMVRAALEGRKTQTRRLMTPQPDTSTPGYWAWSPKVGESHGMVSAVVVGCPYGQPGDRLWVRETWGFSSLVTADAHQRSLREQDTSYLVYRADAGQLASSWRPSIHMPRWASRILLEVTDVRVERLKTISEEDARAEGVEPIYGTDYSNRPCVMLVARDVFATLWDNSTDGKRSPWARNPWVWVVTYALLDQEAKP